MVKNPPAMKETWVWSLCWEDSLEKGMITHSSILAWRMPWAEELGGLQSMGSQNYKYELFWIIFHWSQLLTVSSILLQKIPMHIHRFVSICLSIHPIVPLPHLWRTLLFKKYSWEHGGGPPRGLVVKNSPANAGAAGLIPGLGRIPGEGNDYPLQYSSLGNPMDRGVF